MALDLKVRSITYAGSDPSWLGSAHGTLTNRTVTLDLAAFDFATDFTAGMIPSGVVLGKITATGLYGPYDDAATGTGRETATGHLFTDVDVKTHITALGSTTLTGQVAQTAMFIRGIVDESELPTNHGLDANGKVNLPFIQYL